MTTMESPLPVDEVYRSPKPESGGDRDGGCNCYYEILDVQFDPGQGEAPYRNLEFQTSDHCGLSNPCLYFQAQYYDGPACSTGGLPECMDLWSNLPPSGMFPFDCSIPEFMDFTISFATNYYGGGSGGCGGVPSDTTSITFRIVCVEDCGTGYLSFKYSDPYTLTSSNSDQVFCRASLSGCGCNPILGTYVE